MVKSATLFYRHAEAKYPDMLEACHAQHNDFRQRKSNQYRRRYFEETGRFPDVLSRAPWSSTWPDDRDIRYVDEHPAYVLGRFWTPRETFSYAMENHGSDDFMWHFRDPFGTTDAAGHREYGIADALPVIAEFPDLR